MSIWKLHISISLILNEWGLQIKLCYALLQIYNLFPCLGHFLKTWRDLMKNVEENREDTKIIIADLKETLNPEMCRCFVDAFLTRKLNLEVRRPTSVNPLL